MQKKNAKEKIFIFFVIVLSFSLFAFRLETARAAGVSLGIDPPILQIDATPPTTVKVPITLQNLGNEPVELVIGFKPFTAANEKGEVAYLSPLLAFKGKNANILSLIQIRENGEAISTVSIAPRQEKALEVTMEIPKDELRTDYYFSIVFISKDNITTDPPNTQTLAGIATNVLLSIGPTSQAEGVLEEFSTPFIQESGPVPFTVRVKNTGQHVIAPRGQILITNMFGQVIGRVELLPVNILSGTTRALPDAGQTPGATPSANIESKISSIEPVKAFWHEKILLGPYSATITLALSEEGPLFSRTIHFIGLPWQVGAGVIIAVMIVLLIVSRVKKRMR